MVGVVGCVGSGGCVGCTGCADCAVSTGCAAGFAACWVVLLVGLVAELFVLLLPAHAARMISSSELIAAVANSLCFDLVVCCGCIMITLSFGVSLA